MVDMNAASNRENEMAAQREIEAQQAWTDANYQAIIEATLELSPASAVGIYGTSLENVMEIAAEIVEVWTTTSNQPFAVDVDGERFVVYASGTYYPL